jgi:hypothetical protein
MVPFEILLLVDVEYLLPENQVWIFEIEILGRKT